MACFCADVPLRTSSLPLVVQLDNLTPALRMLKLVVTTHLNLTGAEVPSTLGIHGYNRSATAHHLASKPNDPGFVVLVILGCHNRLCLST